MKSFQYLAPIPPFEYVAPRTISELFDTLEGHGKELQVVAGGTDLTMALKERAVAPRIVVDLGRLRKELGGIAVEGRNLRIGALVTCSQL